MSRVRPRRLALAVLSRLPILGNRFHRVKRRCWLLRMLPGGSVGAEIGVWRGDFSAEILRVVKPRVLHLIDPWLAANDPALSGVWYDRPQVQMDTIAGRVRERFAREIARGSVVIHHARSIEAAARLADSSLDWIYIDGDHTYEGVRNDLLNYAPKVRPGGLVCGDNYAVGGRFQGAVKRAVDEFAAGDGIELVVQRDRQFVLRKKPAGN